MTIAHGRPIIAQDVIDAINAKYPEYINLVPAGLKGSPFVAGITTSLSPDSDTSQALATALALIATGLPVRSKDNIILNQQTYLWSSDELYTHESTGTRVRAASIYGTSMGSGMDHDSALAAAGGANSHLATLASFYQVTGPFFGYSGILFTIFATTDNHNTLSQLDEFEVTPSNTNGTSTVPVVEGDGTTCHNTVDVSLAGPLDNTCVTTTVFSSDAATTGPPNPTSQPETGSYLENSGSGLESPGWFYPGGLPVRWGYQTSRQGSPITTVCVLNFAD